MSNVWKAKYMWPTFTQYRIQNVTESSINGWKICLLAKNYFSEYYENRKQ